MRVLTVVGNRPQFVKAAAVSRPLRERHEEILVHTGQHHDKELSAVFFEELGVPQPERRLEVSGGSNNSQLARMLPGLEALIAELRPNLVLLYGDTNSTLAGALAGADAGVPVAHVEAGMRSHDPTMAEERNRVLTDALSTLLLCSSDGAAENLRGERSRGGIEVVGDVMVDVANTFMPVARERAGLLERFKLSRGAYVLATAHRAGNVDDPERLLALVELLEAIPQAIVLPLHPRTAARLEAAGLRGRLERAALLCGPLGYLDFTMLLCNASAVLTDSGGVQKEAYLAGVPCLTLRDSTEWVETVHSGWNVLVGLDASLAVGALKAFEQTHPPERPALYGDGHAGERVVAALSSLG